MNKLKEARRLRNKKDKEWREAVKKRDNDKCVINDNCSTGFIQAHHIIPRENKIFRHDVDNGVCLCPRHHKYSYDLSAHKNSFVFFLWLLEHRQIQFNKFFKMNW